MDPTQHHARLAAPTSLIDVVMMRRALAQAKLAVQIGEVPVGAVVYSGEQVLAEAHNRRESQADPTAHAEVIAIRIAAQALGSWRLDRCNLAVTLEPCPMCAGALVNARVKRLVYGAVDPKAGSVHSLYQICTDHRLNHRLEVTGGVLIDQCAALLCAFFQQRRRNRDTAK